MLSKFHFFIFLLLLFCNPVFAGSCGSGKITRIEEGGFNTNDFLIVIDYSEAQSDHPGTGPGIYIRYLNTLGERLNGIRSLALAAFMADKTVITFSHENNCSFATNLSIVHE